MPCHDLLSSTLQLAAVQDVIRGAIMVIFIVVSFLVILVVLAQEGKGGGLAGAFGGAGADAFGVKAGTVNKFTAWLAGLFLGLALLHAGLSSETTVAPTGPDTSVYDAGGADDATTGNAEEPAKAPGNPPKDDGPPKKDGN